MRLIGSHDIASTVERFITDNRHRFDGKTVLDVPAGTGRTARLLDSLGARVIALDLFPERFDHPSIECSCADLNDILPVDSDSVDIVVCQEGIEHISDQPAALRELARILRPGGQLLLTTPNSSNLRSRLSYMLGESEHYKLMPPNEIDTVWFSSSDKSRARVYYGHSFLIGFPKLRFLSRLAGLSVKEIYYDRANNLSAALLLPLYPFVLLTGVTSYRRAMRKRPGVSSEKKKGVYREVLKAAINPRNLIVSHIFIELEKNSTPQEAINDLQSINKLS